MSVSIPFTTVLLMLENCAPGFTWRLANHSRVITFNSRTYRTFPKHDDIEIGHIRKMMRHLGISFECGRKYIPVDFEYTDAIVESPRIGYALINRGKILSCRMPDLMIKYNMITTSRLWEKLEKPKQEAVKS